MASGTITGSTSNEYIASKIEWSSTPTTSTNSSKVTATLYYKRTNSGYTTYGSGNFSIIIDGNKYTTHGKVVTITESAWVEVLSHSRVVYHNSDGTKTITISASGGIDGTTLTSTSCSGQAKLDTIPRASSFTLSTGSTTDAGNPSIVVNNSNSIKVSISRFSSSFQHTVKFYFGNTLVTSDTVTVSKSFHLSMAEWLPYIANRRSSADLSDAQAPSVTVTTFSPNGQVGDPVKKRFDISAPSTTATTPTVSMTLTPVSSLASQFSSLYIQGKTKVKVALTGSAKYEASIVAYEASVGGVKKSGATTQSNYLSTAGTVSVTGKVTDSRGLIGTLSKSITVLAYSKPVIAPYEGETKVICERCTSTGVKDDSGTYLHIKVGMKYSKIEVDGVTQNKCAIWYRYKTESASSYSSWVTLIAKDATNDYADVIVADVVPSATTSYMVELYCEDDLGGYARVNFTIPTSQITVHLKKGGKGVGVGKYSETDNCLEISEDWDVTGRLYSLGKGMANIPQSADLNSYKGFGVYNIISNATAKTLVNRPCDDAGVLIVSSGTGDAKQNGTWVNILQRYLTYDGKCEFYRLLRTSDSADVWTYNKWEARSNKFWASLGLASGVSTATVDAGRYQKGCFYRVVNENHVYVAFNCAFTYSGSSIKISGSQIPSPYKPVRSINAYCTPNGRALARVYVNSAGDVYVDHVQSLTASSDTQSYSVTWIDGYIDYWV